VEIKEFRLSYISIEEMAADILTKALNKKKFDKFRKAMGVTIWNQFETLRDCRVRLCPI
jgi:hypothetical protein